MNSSYRSYRQTDISTASPMKLVLMLYDGAISFLNRSAEYAKAGDVRNRTLFANKGRDIIQELNNSLNTEAGGELASQLRSLYFFMNRHLLQATMSNRTGGIQEVIGLLTTLREGWQDAYRQTAATPLLYGQAPASVSRTSQSI